MDRGDDTVCFLSFSLFVLTPLDSTSLTRARIPSFFILLLRPEWFADEGDDEEGTSGGMCNASMRYYTRPPRCTSVP